MADDMEQCEVSEPFIVTRNGKHYAFHCDCKYASSPIGEYKSDGVMEDGDTGEPFVDILLN